MDLTLDSIRQLSDCDVVSGLDDLGRRQHQLGAVIVAHLQVVKERNIHLDMGFSSLIEYCVERLGCSRDVAYKWAAAVKVSEAHPDVLAWLDAGDITTSALAALAPHRDDIDLIVRARGKSRRQIQMMCAAKHQDPNWNRIRFRARPVGEGLSKVEMTVPDTFLEQLEEALDLDSHLDPERDRVALLSRALDTYIARRKRERQKVTDRPRPPRQETTEGVPARVVREAYEISGARCTYVSPEGRRCTARAFLELDHIIARALGGTNDQIRIYCRSHNQYAAEKQLGKEHMDAARRRSQLTRKLAASLRSIGVPATTAGTAAEAAVAALGAGVGLDRLVEEALARAGSGDEEPSAASSAEPSAEPSAAPSAEPSAEPSAAPSAAEEETPQPEAPDTMQPPGRADRSPPEDGDEDSPSDV